MTLTPEELTERADQARQRFTNAEAEAASREIAQKHRGRKASVIPVRLNADLYDAVQAAAAQRHLAPSALIRQWIAQSVSTIKEQVNIADELERLAAIVRAKPA